MSIADSPLGYVDKGDDKQEELFLKLQEYLLSEDTQDEIQRTGRRSGYTGVSEENKEVFRSDWGLQPDRVLSPIKMPASDVLFECPELISNRFPQAFSYRVLPGLFRQYERHRQRTACSGHGAVC